MAGTGGTTTYTPMSVLTGTTLLPKPVVKPVVTVRPVTTTSSSSGSASSSSGSSSTGGSSSVKKNTVSGSSSTGGSSSVSKNTISPLQSMMSSSGVQQKIAAPMAAAAGAPQKDALKAAFLKALASGAQQGKAVPTPAGLSSDEADKLRSQFYSNMPVQRIVDNTGSAQNMLAYDVNKRMDPALLASLNDPFGRVAPTYPPAYGLLGADRPQYLGPVAPSYGQGINTIGMPQMDYVAPGTNPYGRGIDAVGMPQMDYVAPGDPRITFVPQAARPGVPAGMPAALPAANKNAISSAFLNALAQAARTGGAVSNPPGLSGAEADKLRSQFYSNMPVQRIVDNTGSPQAMLSYDVNKRIDPALLNSLSSPFGVEAPPLPMVPGGTGIGFGQTPAAGFPATAVAPFMAQGIRPGQPSGLPAAPFMAQGVRPGTPAGMPAAPFVPQGVRPGQPSGMPAAPAPSYGMLGAERPGVPTSMMRDRNPNMPADQLNSRGIASRLLDYIAPQRVSSETTGGGFNPISFLISEAKGDEYIPDNVDPSKVAPVPYNYPRTTQVGATTMPLQDIVNAVNKQRFAGLPIAPQDQVARSLQQGIGALGGSYDPATGQVTIPNAAGPQASAAKNALLNPDKTAMTPQQYKGALLVKELIGPYIENAKYTPVPPIPNTRPVPPDLTAPDASQTMQRGMFGRGQTGIAAARPENQIATRSVPTVAVDANGNIVAPQTGSIADAVAGFGGPDLGSSSSPMNYQSADLSAPQYTTSTAPTAVKNALNISAAKKAQLYALMGQQEPLDSGNVLAYSSNPRIAAALAQAPQITAELTRTNPPGPPGTTARGQPMFPSISEPQRGPTSQTVAQSRPAPAEITVAGGNATSDAGMFGRGQPAAAQPTVASTAEPDSGLGPELFSGETEYNRRVAEEAANAAPAGFEQQVTASAGANRTPTGAKRFTPAEGQTVGTNGYIYEVSGTDAQGKPVYKNVGKVPGYTDAQLYAAANKGTFRDQSNIPQGGTTPKPPSALRTWARGQLDKYNAEVTKKKAEAEAKGEKYDPVSFMDYLSLAGSAATGNVAGMLMKGGQMLYPQIIEWLANGPSTTGDSNAPMMDGSPSSSPKKKKTGDGTSEDADGNDAGTGGTKSSKKKKTNTGTTGTVTPTGADGGYTMKDFAQYLPYLNPVFPPSSYNPGVSGEWNYFPGSEKTYAQGGTVNAPRLVLGAGGPTEDKIPARIDGVHEAKLSNGEFVITAAAVKGIGGGDMQRGAAELMKLNDMFSSRPDSGRLKVEKVR